MFFWKVDSHSRDRSDEAEIDELLGHDVSRSLGNSQISGHSLVDFRERRSLKSFSSSLVGALMVSSGTPCIRGSLPLFVPGAQEGTEVCRKTEARARLIINVSAPSPSVGVQKLLQSLQTDVALAKRFDAPEQGFCPMSFLLYTVVPNCLQPATMPQAVSGMPIGLTVSSANGRGESPRNRRLRHISDRPPDDHCMIVSMRLSCSLTLAMDGSKSGADSPGLSLLKATRTDASLGLSSRP